jgi:hypothetical protein
MPGTAGRPWRATGLVNVTVCAMTEIWSGRKFVRRLKDH